MNRYIIQIYNHRTNGIIGYIVNSFTITKDINQSGIYSEDLGLITYGKTFIDNVYKKHKVDSVSEHTFGHIKEDYFKNLGQYDVFVRLLDKDVVLRKLKIDKIKKG